ncbi:ATP-binding protein [Streptomyces fulvoviolaceus]|uniref:ATP-binding protein n=1 Tax=Streptomyces fulvoviolaceus TaxID=285535 RepID=UPI0007C52160|nr:LuxR family transcriptional regulator [Streptomyces fulvoviolaceus]
MTEAYDMPEQCADTAPFVGRAAELGRLGSALDRLGKQGPAVIDITGEAGIGKSRLLAEFSAHARGRGLTVLRGRATEYEQHSPFRPFADAFADLDERALEAFPVLSELAPVLRGVMEKQGGPGAGDRFGLYQATAAVLGRLGGPGLVVMLDDLHWADSASLELVDYLIRHPSPAPLLLVVSRRNRQAPTALTTALARGRDTGTVLRLALKPLGERDCVESLASDLPGPQAAQLYSASEGNPLYFLALLQAHRGARMPSCASQVSLGSWGPDGLPADLKALLLDELSPLSPLERRTVEAAAVLGDHITPDMISAITNARVADVIEALHQLMRRDLLRQGQGQGGRGLALRHPLIRALVHESVAPWWREELHRRAAAELEGAGASAVERAHHLEQSLTRWDPQAAAVLTTAAEQSAATAPAVSAHWLQVVLRLLPDTPEYKLRRRELTLLRAHALGMAGGLRESRNLLHQLIDLPGEDDDAVHIAAVALCAMMECRLGRYPESDALLRRELARSPGRPLAQTVELRLQLVYCAVHAGRFPEVRAEITQALATARSLGDDTREMHALALAAMGEGYEGDIAAARSFAAPAARLVDALTDDNLAGLCESLSRLAWAEVFLEDYTTAERHASRGLEIARRTGQLYLLPQFLLCKAHVHFNTCRIATALELADEAEPITRALGSSELLAFALALRAQILLMARRRGDPEALAVAEEAVAAAGTSDSWWASLASCMLAHTAGDPHRVREVLLHAGGGSHLRRLQPSVRCYFLELLVNAAIATGDVEEAEHWAERAHKEAEQLGLPAQRAAALRSHAQIAAHRGDAVEAARLFAEAAADTARSGATLREAQALLLGAGCMKAAGDGVRAAAMWHRGFHLASEGGARLLVGLAERTRPAVLDGPAARTDALATLTVREREIAELVSAGLTSQAIATELFLSRRTVESHLSRIYRKTEVSSRSALASLVARGSADAARRAQPKPGLLPRATPRSGCATAAFDQ